MATSNSLQFDEALSWRAGRPIALADLTKRLQKLAKELRELQQEDFDRESILTVAKDLASHNLIAHKDKGVKAYVACCLADALRVCAPTAPYTANQLKEIFTLFVNTIIPALADSTSAYHSQHLYVLRSLAELKSMILMTELPGSEPLVRNLFASAFDVISDGSRTEQVGRTIELNMTSVLSTVIEECSVLPPESVEIIVAQFLRVDPHVIQEEIGAKAKGKKDKPEDGQTMIQLKELPVAYSMAKNLCNTSADKMARHFSQYFNEVMVTDSTVEAHRQKSVDDSDEPQSPAGLTEADYGDLSKVHRLLRELWRACPAVLASVIPQVEVELSAENLRIRLLAINTIGDMIAGIGAAGPPPTTRLDPATYPQVLLSAPPAEKVLDILRTPSSPQPFSQTHPAAYESFLGRKADRSAVIRAAWTTCIGQIIATSAGGVGLTEVQERRLVQELSDKLVDPDDRVRIAAIQVIDGFGFRDVVVKLGILGGVDEDGSVLKNLADRAMDKKHAVRVEGMQILGRLWGVASGEIASQNTLVTGLLGTIPSKIFDGFYKNDQDVNLLIDHVLHEMLIPFSYPPNKAKKASGVHNGDRSEEQEDLDEVRAQRILTLISGLDDRALSAFIALLRRQGDVAKCVSGFVLSCQRYNGGTIENIEGREPVNEAEVRIQLSKLVDWFARQFPDSVKASADLWKLIKMNDRRLYRLMLWCISSDSDHKNVRGSIREIIKRLQGSASSSVILDTLVPILYRSSYLIFNKSHVPAAVKFSQTNDQQLAHSAQTLLKEMSAHAPAVFKGYVQELCDIIEKQAPTATRTNEPGIVDHLKALAGFARTYPDQIPQSKKFFDSLTAFALHGTPAAVGKQAVNIIMAAAKEKDVLADDMLDVCISEFDYEDTSTLVRLSTMAQLCLRAHDVATGRADEIAEIAISKVLSQRRTRPDEMGDKWLPDDKLDKEILTKELALRIMVNRIRSAHHQTEARHLVPPVFVLLNHLIQHEGQLPNQEPPPALHAARLRLLAGKLVLKLCATPYLPKGSTSASEESHRTLDTMYSAANFNSLCLLVLDPLFPVRSRFVASIRKNLSRQSRPLPERFYTLPFILAFEPEPSLKKETQTWCTARARHLGSINDTTLERSFMRLLSLLSHHPDFDTLDDAVEDPAVILEIAPYITFYLKCVATEENIGMIFYIAGRVKGVRDAVGQDSAAQQIASHKLWALCDLAQAVIKKWEELSKWQMLAWPGKISLPSSLFGNIEGGMDRKLEITSTVWCPQEALDGVEDYVRKEMQKPALASDRGRKRKSVGEEGGNAGVNTEKKAKKDKEMKLPVRASASDPKSKSALPGKAGSKPKAKVSRAADASTAATRRSSRAASGKVSYRDMEDGEIDGMTYEEDDDDDADADADKDEEEDEVVNEPSSPPDRGTSEEEPVAEPSSSTANGPELMPAKADIFDIPDDGEDASGGPTSPPVPSSAPSGPDLESSGRKTKAKESTTSRRTSKRAR